MAWHGEGAGGSSEVIIAGTRVVREIDMYSGTVEI